MSRSARRGIGSNSCPRAGCGRSACPVRSAGCVNGTMVRLLGTARRKGRKQINPTVPLGRLLTAKCMAARPPDVDLPQNRVRPNDHNLLDERAATRQAFLPLRAEGCARTSLRPGRRRGTSRLMLSVATSADVGCDCCDISRHSVTRICVRLGSRGD